MLLRTNPSVSAVNKIRCPFATWMPSILYPYWPSIVENTSVVNVSTRSTSGTDCSPKLNNFNPASNSIIGRTARAV